MWFDPPDGLTENPIFAIKVYRDGNATLLLDERPPRPQRTKRGRILWLRAKDSEEALRRARNKP